MKKTMILMAAALCTAMLSACSGGTAATQAASTQAASTQQAAATQAAASAEAPKQAVTISLGHVNAPGEPITRACDYWAEKLKEISGGEMVIETYPSSQLGSMTDVYDMALANDSVIAYGHNGYLADLGVPDLNAIYAPFLFDSWDDFEKINNSDWMKENLEKVHEKGITVVSSGWHYGVRQTLTKDPVNSVSDLKGKKIRIPNSTAQIVGYETLGAVATPMNLSECYTALQQGTIDGMDNPVDVLYGGKFQEVAKYLTLTNHFYNDANWSVGNGFFDSLTPQEQEWLLESGRMATEYFNEIAAESAAEATEKMKEEGVTVSEIDLGDTSAYTEAYFANSSLNLSDGVYDTLKGILAK